MRILLNIVRFLGVLIAAVAVGFLLGRLTAPRPKEAVAEPKKEYAVPPSPPKMEVEEKALVLETPIDGARIDGTVLDVSGRAEAGETPIRLVLKDPAGQTVTETSVPVISAAGSTFGRFQASFTLDPAPTAPLTLEVSREGSSETPVTRVISFGSHDAVTMRTYYRLGATPDGSCGTVEPFARVSTIEGGVYRAGLDVLLQGPSTEEDDAGYVTALPKKAKLRSVAADASGVVTADFEKGSFDGVDACEKETILAQISATLRQFPETRDVVVTVAGERFGFLTGTP